MRSILFNVLKRGTAVGLLAALLGPNLALPAAATGMIGIRPAASPMQINATPYGADVNACSQIRMTDVAAVVAQRESARIPVVQAVAPPVMHWRDDPKAYHAFLEKTKPHTAVTIAMHPMTTTEYATFRAAAFVDQRMGTLNDAVRSCRTEALARTARVGGVRPMWQSCGGQPCPCPPAYKRSNASNGTYDILALRSVCTGQASSDTAYTSSGSVYTTGATSLVTITGYPGAKSAIPAATHSVPSQYGTVTHTLPSPQYVPQSGWDAVPGAKDSNGNQLYAYINPTDDSVAASFDSSHWMVAEDLVSGSSVSSDLYYSFGTNEGTTPTLVADSIDDGFLCAGSLIGFGVAMAAILGATDGLALPFWAAIAADLGVVGSCAPLLDSFGDGVVASNYEDDFF